MTITLPPLDTATREQLIEIIHMLHGGLVQAQADYDALKTVTTTALQVGQELLDRASPPTSPTASKETNG